MNNKSQQNNILEKDLELEKRARDVIDIEKQILNLMNLMIKMLASIPTDLDIKEELWDEHDETIVEKLLKNIDDFGNLVESLSSQLREHFTFFHKNGIRDRALPINVARSIKLLDNLLMNRMIDYLEQDISCQSINEQLSFKRY